MTFELIGKARELASKIGHEVYCVFMGSGITNSADELLHYGADKVFVYDDEKLKNYISETYTAVFEDFINKVKPSVILVAQPPSDASLHRVWRRGLKQALPRTAPFWT